MATAWRILAAKGREKSGNQLERRRVQHYFVYVSCSDSNPAASVLLPTSLPQFPLLSVRSQVFSDLRGMMWLHMTSTSHRARHIVSAQ